MTVPLTLSPEDTRRLAESHARLREATNRLYESLPWGLICGAGIDIDDDGLHATLHTAAAVDQDIRLTEARLIRALDTDTPTD